MFAADAKRGQNMSKSYAFPAKTLQIKDKSETKEKRKKRM